MTSYFSAAMLTILQMCLDATVLESLGSEVCAAVAKMDQLLFVNEAVTKGWLVRSRLSVLLFLMHPLFITCVYCCLR